MARNRTYRIIHEPLLTEWLMQNYPPGSWRTNVRVGPVAPELKAAAEEGGVPGVAKLVTGSVDGVVELPDRTVLVEAMVRVEHGKIQQLKNYAQLYRSDPEFSHRAGLPIELVLLTPFDIPFVKAMAEREGVRYAVYRPSWIEPLLGSLPPRIGQGHLQGVVAY
jgi:hypothetical protein